jgi:predicted acylesterase/phospholipase RssA
LSTFIKGGNTKKQGAAMTTDQHPFERIALTLSGGGTRAMGFHLGTLSYLDRVGLLERVRILSTVSGGTAIGIGYAAYRQLAQGNERPLMTLYREMRERIPTDPAELLKLLQDAAVKYPSAPSGRRTLISNLAEMCNTIFKFCDGKRFDIFWNEKPTHLEEIIFNATEFMTGVGFRFHKSSIEEQCDSGCAIAKLPTKYARQARLADIMAASACIPIGFEPIEFPEDFRWPDDKVPVPNPDDRRICAEICRQIPADPQKPDRKQRSITLMDGGVYDNQGIFSVLNILGLTRDVPKGGDTYIPSDVNLYGLFGNRRGDDAKDRKAKEVDLFIVSDTPLRDFPIYELAAGPDRTSRLDLAKLKWIIYGALLLLLGSTLSLLIYYFWVLPASAEHSKSLLDYIRDFFIYIIPLILTSGFLAGALFLSHRVKEYFGRQAAFRYNPQLRPRLWKYFKKRRFSDLGYMVESRLSSAFKMNSDVFLNRIRYLGLTGIFNLAPLKGKVIINVIDSMIRDKRDAEAAGEGAEKYKEKILNLLQDAENLYEDTVAKASTVPTQFWLAKEDLADLLACGQATTCYNLLKHLQFMLDNNPDLIDNDAFKKLYNDVEKDWVRLKTNSYALVEDPYAQ